MIEFTGHLLRIERSRNSVLLLFDDDEDNDTIIKFQACLEEHEDVAQLVRAEPNFHDRYALGLLTDTEYQAALTLQQAHSQAEQAEARLAMAWAMFATYGADGGFAEPTKYPAEVARQIQEIDWSSTQVEQKLITYKDVNFIIQRPKES